MAKAKKNIDLDVTPAQEEKKNKYEFEFPYWSNKEAKHMIVTINYPNGTRATASIQDNDGSNPDYKRIMEEFGEEQIDANRSAAKMLIARNRGINEVLTINNLSTKSVLSLK